VEYLARLADDEADEWQDFDSREALFVWRSPRLPGFAAANRLGSNTLLFQAYEAFLSH
jgi:hypothetical protein